MAGQYADDAQVVHDHLRSPTDYRPASATSGTIARRVTLVIWQDPGWHPTVAHTSQVLSELGIDVQIVARYVPHQRSFIGDVDFGSRAEVQLIRPPGRGPRSYADLAHFCWEVARATRRRPPSAFIGYDLHGIIAARAAAATTRGSILIYHDFDLPAENPAMRRLITAGVESSCARRADCVVVSSEGRARIIRHHARLSRPPLVINNAERLARSDRVGDRCEAKASLGLAAFARVVVRLGSLGPGHGLEATIGSVRAWHEGWGLVLAGGSSQSYAEELQSLGFSLGVGDRVRIMPNVSRELWYRLASSADLGIALYENSGMNQQTMAGAGNKLNLYMSVGIPAIVPNLESFRDLLARYPLGSAADPTSPSSIAESVTVLLGSASAYNAAAAAARDAFRSEFNFEHQVRPLLNFLSGHGVVDARRLASAEEAA